MKPLIFPYLPLGFNTTDLIDPTLYSSIRHNHLSLLILLEISNGVQSIVRNDIYG